MDSAMEDEENDNQFPVCLKHSPSWRNRFQNLMNLLRNNPIKTDIIDRFGKVVCVCDPVQRIEDGSITSMSSIDPSKWQRVSERDYGEAAKYFEEYIAKQDQCSELHSHLQFHYKHMRDSNLFADGDTSAKRFLYLFYTIDKFNNYSFLKPLRAVTNEGEPKFEFKLPLAKLKQEYIGLFIGRRGRKLKGHLKSFKNVKVSVNKEGDSIIANISCKPEDKDAIINKLSEAEEFLCSRREAHEERVREYDEEHRNDQEHSMDI